MPEIAEPITWRWVDDPNHKFQRVQVRECPDIQIHINGAGWKVVDIANAAFEANKENLRITYSLGEAFNIAERWVQRDRKKAADEEAIRLKMEDQLIDAMLKRGAG